MPYSGKCRNLALDEIKTRIMNKEDYAVRIKSDLMELPPYFEDEVFGKLEFKELDDFVVVRKNGWPTFHLSNVVDDWQMKITHVMRGEEWLTNTNKHIYLYRVLGAEVPKFVHLPLIKAMNGKKLAKRDPQYSIQSLKDKHY